jgi:hypothetical protein
LAPQRRGNLAFDDRSNVVVILDFADKSLILEIVVEVN